jgi:hypothetical protein
MIKLKDLLLEATEDDKYTHIGYGKYKLKGKEDDKDAETFTKDDSGKYIATRKDSGGGVIKKKDSTNTKVTDFKRNDDEKQDTSKKIMRKNKLLLRVLKVIYKQEKILIYVRYLFLEQTYFVEIIKKFQEKKCLS